MTIAFISDLHLNPRRPASSEHFNAFMQQHRGRLNQLYILGDLFEYWLGDDAGARLGYAPVEAELRRMSDLGCELFFLHGNRDFLVGAAFAARTGCTLLIDPHPIMLGGRRILLTHGDLLCTDDLPYQRMRRWRTRLFANGAAWVHRLPISLRVGIADYLRKRSARHQQSAAPATLQENRAAVREFIAAHAADGIIYGHVHRPEVYTLEAGGREVQCYVLGDWDRRPSVLLYEDEGFELR